MRIAYVTDGIAPWVVGGMQTVSRRHIELLAERGAALLVFHAFRHGPPESPPDLPGESIVLDWPHSRGLMRRIPGHYVGELAEYSRAVARRLEQESVDVVYLEGPLGRALLRQPDGARPPVIFHPHGLTMFQNNGAWLENLRVRPLRGITAMHAHRADAVISQGGRLGDILLGLGVSPERVRRLPNGADTPLPPEHGPFRPPGERRVLFVGRYERRKGAEFLLDAVERRPEVHLDIVGHMPDRLQRRTMGGRVVFHGVIRDRDRLDEFYAAADALALPSFAEGMATVILEAMRFGLPVVATDVGANADCVDDPGTGRLIPAGDAVALARALDNMSSLPDTDMRAMSGQARRVVAERFNWARIGDELFELCRSAATRR